jgi:hypothetical protein
MFLFLSTNFFTSSSFVWLDASEPRQFGFQSVATPVMEGIINFHNHIMFFLIGVGVFLLLFRCLFSTELLRETLSLKIIFLLQTMFCFFKKKLIFFLVYFIISSLVSEQVVIFNDDLPSNFLQNCTVEKVSCEMTNSDSQFFKKGVRLLTILSIFLFWISFNSIPPAGANKSSVSGLELVFTKSYYFGTISDLGAIKSFFNIIYHPYAASVIGVYGVLNARSTLTVYDVHNLIPTNVQQDFGTSLGKIEAFTRYFFCDVEKFEKCSASKESFNPEILTQYNFLADTLFYGKNKSTTKYNIRDVVLYNNEATYMSVFELPVVACTEEYLVCAVLGALCLRAVVDVSLVYFPKFCLDNTENISKICLLLVERK